MMAVIVVVSSMLRYFVHARCTRLTSWLLNFSVSAILSVICYGSSWAAEFSRTPTAGGPDIIVIAGDFVLGDEKKFIDLALGSQSAFIVLQSPGGNLYAGIEIGRAIHLKGFGTLVPDGVRCASACALAWLGGSPRVMGDTGQVGFHAVYTTNDGQPAVSSAGNALVGAYLNQLGLSTSAVLYITSPSPHDMQWLSFSDARRVGIDVQPFKSSPVPTDKPRQVEELPIRRDGSGPHLATIKSATYRFVTATNRPNDEVMIFLGGVYSDGVNYFGKTMAKSAVLADKRAFFNRWPKRNYSIRPDSLSVSCESNTSCHAQGIVDWSVSGNSKMSIGSASVNLNWNKSSGDWKIDSENSRIVSRQVSSFVASEKLPVVPRYHLDGTSTKLLSLSNLSPDSDCWGAWTTGKVVKRQFGEDGLTLKGVILEGQDGSREFINVDVSLDNIDMATRSWVARGLHTLLAEGRSPEAYIRLCGAAGRVEMLDALQ
jgi:hypothetical protein